MSASAHKKFLALVDKRLEKFVSLMPRVLVSDRPETIHQSRVWSRRLQQVFRVLFPKPATGKARKLMRTLRKTRRSLGASRNIDVALDLVQKRIDAAKDDAARDGWRRVQEYLHEKRSPELRQARRELSQCDVMSFIGRARAALESADQELDPEQSLRKSIEQCLIEWSDALDQAAQDQKPKSFHAFRIAGKRLRYALELLAELGDRSSTSKVKVLKKLQDEIGDWHDRQALLQSVADFISRPDFLADRPDLAKTLLAEMERERQLDQGAIEAILKSAERIRNTWAAGNNRRRAAKGNGADEGVELLGSRGAGS
jgi:CHAD domain-containing protein